MQTPEPENYLASSAFIDWQNPSVLALAKSLASRTDNKTETAKQCFEWVRDNIEHSMDFKRNPVTCKASDVLKHRTGYCYAKSHLLAALLRANQIPAGLCYQRLSIDDQGAPFSLHGLNAIYLDDIGWYRVDARGNKPGINAQFIPPEESLAFGMQFSQEKLFDEILAEPLDLVTDVLTTYSNYLDVYHHLPDTEHILT